MKRIGSRLQKLLATLQIAATLFFSTSVLSTTAWAEIGPLEKEETESSQVKDRPEWDKALKEKFLLNDEQIKSMQSKGLNYPQMAIVAGLAQNSGKSIDDVTKMRLEGNMGWGKIAHELGVPPKEIGQSVRAMRHKIQDNRLADKKERREEKREERRERREKHQQERHEKRATKQAERADRKAN